MGKNYRNCTAILIQIRPPSRLQEDPTKKKGLITNSSLSASTASRIREKYGECISPSPSSEKQPESSSPSRKKTPGGSSKAPPSSEECTATVSSPPRNSSSITCSASLSTSSSTADCKPEFHKMHSTPSRSIRQDASSSKDTSVWGRTW